MHNKQFKTATFPFVKNFIYFATIILFYSIIKIKHNYTNKNAKFMEICIGKL